MVTLPPEFVATKYPGYFFNTVDEKVYSIKVTGELKPMAYCAGYTRWDGKIDVPAGYKISYRGRRPILTLAYLHTIAKNQDSVMGIYDKNRVVV